MPENENFTAIGEIATFSNYCTGIQKELHFHIFPRLFGMWISFTVLKPAAANHQLLSLRWRWTRCWASGPNFHRPYGLWRGGRLYDGLMATGLCNWQWGGWRKVYAFDKSFSEVGETDSRDTQVKNFGTKKGTGVNMQCVRFLDFQEYFFLRGNSGVHRLCPCRSHLHNKI